MGSRGPLSKPDDQRQRHPKPVVVPLGSPPDVPSPPPKLLKATRQAWDRYWESDVARAVTPAEWSVVERYFTYADEHARALSVLRRGHRTVEGSRGQVRLNPLADYLSRLESSMVRLETELGLTPMARARLGIAVGTARLTAAEVNRMALDPADADNTEEVSDDGWEPA